MIKSSNTEVDNYINGVLTGEIIACKWVKLAAQKHIDDLETAHERGLYFDESAAQHVIDFFQFLKHSKGEWANRTIVLAPWQQFFVWCVFGWMKDDDTRRYRTAYLEVARKNGKTTFLSGVGLYLMIADNEPGAEVYAVATKKDQARILHSESKRMVQKSSYLSQMVDVYRDNLSILNTASKFEPLGRDSDTVDGLNVHGAIIDELHAHKNRDMYDVIDTATGSRRQPLITMITTAGVDRNSICFEQHEYTQRILEGTTEDDSHFGLIYTLDEKDDYEDESNWLKANPNLGISKKWDDMKRKVLRVKEMPSSLNNFLRKELDLWVQSDVSWMNMDRWLSLTDTVSEQALRGRRCYAGLDLSSTTDISALVLVFPPDAPEDKYQVLFRFFIPENAMIERSKRDRVPYDVWVRQGLITATPGDVIDYKAIYSQFDRDAQTFDFESIAFDRWGATKLAQDLAEQGAEMVEFGQGFASMSSPMKELETLVLSNKIAHGNNPVANWMMSNVVSVEDPAGNIKPDKSKSREKIDGVVALIMGLQLAIMNTKSNNSIYDEREVREI